jgi:hypothetical protein
MNFPKLISLRVIALFALLLVAAPIVSAQPVGKVPDEVIDQVADDGTDLVLVGLKVPWHME